MKFGTGVLPLKDSKGSCEGSDVCVALAVGLWTSVTSSVHVIAASESKEHFIRCHPFWLLLQTG
ncbi:MAG: hypothetical protein R3E83_06080 [Burkholderiaceae bacterium]